MLKGREGKEGERRGDTFPELKVIEYGSIMGTEVSEGELEMTFEMKAVARTSKSLVGNLRMGEPLQYKQQGSDMIGFTVKKGHSRGLI